MKALSLWQPWASLVSLGVKRIETRSWSTKYRGPLAIHAAVRRPDMEMLEDGMGGELWDGDECLAQWNHGERRDYFPHAIPPTNGRWSLYLAPDFSWRPLPLGAIVATCELVDCVSTDALKWALDQEHIYGWWMGDWVVRQDQRPYGDFGSFRYAWLLADIKPVDPPVPAKGHQGLWGWTEP